MFAGLAAGERVDNPGVAADLTIAAAATAHLARYGPMFEAPTSTFAQNGSTYTVSGQDVVRFTQQVGGVPVIGGEVVLSLRPDRELGSMLATLSDLREVDAAAVSEASALATAQEAAGRTLGVPATGFEVSSLGRWVFDPVALGSPSAVGARTVWRLAVSGGHGVRRLVLVDDQTGGVLLNADALQRLDRVVCDAENEPPGPCTTSVAARVEGGPAAAGSEVNSAFDLSGVVSDFYQEIGDLDLTEAIGIDVDGDKKLASTVRVCPTGEGCPYANAFWDGTQMFYGEGYAGADDVVGHEMTHGIVDQYSELFYWGQSGAINESVADIMGEIVDHRNPSAGDSATDWRIGEDLPIGAIRDLGTPAAHGQPDLMTSPLYTADPGYHDRGGVHTNSGVGNKTAYLISQGGTFNGQTIIGIDGADAGLSKTAKLYLDVIQSLTSGSDYADLARVLEQSCQDFVGTEGFTATDCANVQAAVLATELRTTPSQAPQPADAPATCPSGSTKRVLFDSETGTPAGKFAAGSTWTRVPDGAIRSNATSGRTSWFSQGPGVRTNSALVLKTGLTLPREQKAYLWFQHWRLFEHDLEAEVPFYYDGGTVEVDDLATTAGAVSAASLPWVNGPKHVLLEPERTAFGGDSFGWIASRVSLSSYAGRTVKPRFTMRSDHLVASHGWFLDDVRVYTCDLPRVSTTTQPTASGTAKVGRKLTAGPGTWKPAGVTFSYRWLRSGKAISTATAKSYVLKAADRGKRISVKVTGSRTGYRSLAKTSAQTVKVK